PHCPAILQGWLFSFLIHRREASLISLPQLKDKSSQERISEAFGLAERILSIPRLLDSADIINGNIDEKSLLTYLSYFRSYLNKPLNLHQTEMEMKLQTEMDQLRKQIAEDMNARGDSQTQSRALFLSHI